MQLDKEIPIQISAIIDHLLEEFRVKDGAYLLRVRYPAHFSKDFGDINTHHQSTQKRNFGLA